jgi:hypothetical protein
MHDNVHVEAKKEKDNTITTSIHQPTKDWAGTYTCQIKTDNNNVTKKQKEETLTISHWEKDKELGTRKFNINSDEKDKSIKKGDAITIECTANSSIPFDVIISHEGLKFYTYDHRS